MSLRYPKMLARPRDFLLNPEWPLYRQAAFLGLSAQPGDVRYPDASMWARHGALIGYTGTGNTPGNKWKWDAYLNRFCLEGNDSTDYVTAPIFGAVTYPLTLAGWAYPLDVTGNHHVIELANPDATVDALFLSLVGAAAGDLVSAYSLASSTYAAATAGAFLANQWVHVAGVYRSIASRTAYKNAVSGAEETTSKNVTTADRILLHAHKGGAIWDYGNARIADALVLSGDQSWALPQLADPSNVTLCIGKTPLILPPRRRLFAVATGETSTVTGACAVTTTAATCAGAGTFAAPIYTGASALSTTPATCSAAGAFIAPGPPTGGTWTISYNGETTAALDFDATAAEVQTALQTITGFEDASVYCESEGYQPFPAYGGKYLLIFNPALGDIAEVTVDSYLTGGDPVLTPDTVVDGVLPTEDPPDPGINEQQTITLTFTGVCTGTAALQTTPSTCSASGDYDVPLWTGLAGCITAAIQMAASGTFTPPVYTGTATLTTTAATCSAVGTNVSVSEAPAMVAGQVYSPGLIAGEVYQVGIAKGQVYAAGIVAGHVIAT